MAESKILVTGAAGFIAFHLIEKLLREGESVLGIDNFDPFYPREVKEKNLTDLKSVAEETQASFEFQEMDFCDLNENDFEEETFSEIIHLGAKAGVRPSLKDPKGYLKANVEGTLALLEFAKKRRIDRFLFGSSSSVYGDSTPVPFSEEANVQKPISPYAASKAACELYCHTYAHLYGARVASLRFFTVYGPRQRPDLAIHKFSRLIWKGEEIPVYGDGTTRRDYTFVSDIVSGVISALSWVRNAPEHAYEIFNLGGSKTVSLKELIEKLEKNLDQKAKRKALPLQPGDVQQTYADVSKSKRILNYDPQFPLDRGLEIFSDWFKSTV